jgi:hypothetical protein
MRGSRMVNLGFLRKVNLGRVTNAEHRCEEDGRQERSNVVAVQLDVVRWEIPVLFGRLGAELYTTGNTPSLSPKR